MKEKVTYESIIVKALAFAFQADNAFGKCDETSKKYQGMAHMWLEIAKALPKKPKFLVKTTKSNDNILVVVEEM